MRTRIVIMTISTIKMASLAQVSKLYRLLLKNHTRRNRRHIKK